MLWSNLLWLLMGVGLTLLVATGSFNLYQWRQHRRYGDARQVDVQLHDHYHQMAANIADQAGLDHLLTQPIPRSLGIERAALLLLEEHELVGGDNLRLAVNNVAVRQVAASGSAMLVAGELRHLIEQNRLDLRWTAVWVPVMRSTTLHGLWLLSQGSEGHAFTPTQLQSLTTLARQAALIIDTLKIAKREQAVTQQLQTMYQQAVSASEIERSRLSHELHDGVLQDLCAIARDLKMLENRGDRLGERLETLRSYANEAVNTLRLICHNLRPPLLNSSLPLALQALVERTNRHAAVSISFKCAIDGLLLPEETTVAVYRIAQEALNNAVQHADASEILVRLTQYPDSIRLTVSDDGRGIDHPHALGSYVDQGHFGLAGMVERAKMIGANLSIQSAQEYGTAVILHLALPMTIQT